MELSRNVVSPLFPHSLPAAQEAAVLYANGHETDAADVLHHLLQAGGSGCENAELWYMLFDLLRSRGEWSRFEALAERFHASFGTLAPPWLDEEEMLRLPVEVRPGGPGYFQFSGTLDASGSLKLDQVRAAARKLATVHLDVSRLAALGAAGCAALLELMQFLPANGNGLLITGADHLADLLNKAAEGNPSVEAFWTLLLDIYRVRGQQGNFERIALEYALATGVAPPTWQPLMMPVAPRTTHHEKRDEPRYDPGPQVVHLSGVMWGSTDPQLVELRAFGEGRDYVNINLSQLRRMDFSCATAFGNLLNELAVRGKKVRLIRPNNLVAVFLSTLNLNVGVELVRARTGLRSPVLV